MAYKKHIVILLVIIAVIAAMFFAVLLFNKQKQDVDSERKALSIQELVDKKNNKEKLNFKEEEYLEKTILDKLKEKTDELRQKSKEEKKLYGYTEEELKFIANPRRTVEEELGIKQKEKKVKFYTQEELENIANPK